MMMNKKTALRNLLFAGLLILLSIAATVAALFYIGFFRSLPR